MTKRYHILSKRNIDSFPFQKTEKKIIPVEPDLLIDLSFSPKLFVINDISPVIEKMTKSGVEWIDSCIDCSPSQPQDDEVRVYENFRTPYIHRTFRLTTKEKKHDELNWLDIDEVELDFSKLDGIPLEERLIFKLEEDFGYIFIHHSIIEALRGGGVKDVWIRGE